jgi:glycosyltransferase involved in cell wall biosynthesis
MAKRVLVVTSDVPFVEGGHMIIARATVRALRDCGHEADLVLTPQNRFGRQFQAYLATRLTDVGLDGLGRPIDRIISFRFPSYAVKHPRHVCWLNHRLREYYDLWDDLRSRLGPAERIKETVRRGLIRAVDTRLLKHNVTRVYAQSAMIRDRLKTWGNIPSEVLHPPAPQRAYRRERPGDYIFSVSRLTKLKRLDLLVEAFAFVRNRELKARIAGDGPELEPLRALVRARRLENRIAFLGAVGEEEVLSGYAGSLAVFFCPLREDYGLVTPEAFASGKAVITTQDSGGPTELVRDGETGFIVAPDPKAIALRIDELAADKALAERMGGAGYATGSRMRWDEAVAKLLS